MPQPADSPAMQPPTQPADSFVTRATAIRPSERQYNWQQLEFYAFAHFGINTFTNREWGMGNEDPALFNPRRLDTDQWCRTFRDAGMRGVILTAKHHDGFCLWDTKQTTHSSMHSPLGRDVLAELAESCRRHDLKLGVYVSPWDRHEPSYGQGRPYDDFFCAQLEEVLTGYGELFCLWFDGANGEGPNGRKQDYDWPRYYALIRRLQPGAVISICGPDVRWCGNEAGHCRLNEWSVVPASLSVAERIQAGSQQADDSSFRTRFTSADEDLGSRQALADVKDLIWYPVEVDTSIRPGWFYHPEEDGQVRSLEMLQSIYLASVGGNAALLLNVPPDRDGLIAPPDAARLAELGAWLRQTFRHNLLATAAITATADTVTATVPAAIQPRWLMVQEDIRQSQRVEAFSLEAEIAGCWQELARGTTIGHKRIMSLPAAPAARRWRLVFRESRGPVELANFALY
ncbi:MAG: alpha-L-fucosidase [Bacillota bacterium]|nr:alpha-L-fucosidase [Bacillota bacterium]